MTERRQQFASWRHALRQLVTDVGGYPAMSKLMWPKRSARTGADRISKWLREGRRERPSLEDIERMLWIGRLHGEHVAFHDLSDRLNYSRSEPVDTKEKLAAMAEGIRRKQASLADLIESYKQLKLDHDVTNAGAATRFVP